MIVNFLITTAVVGIVSGILGYVGLDMFFFEKIASASPGRQLVYIIVLVISFAVVFSATILGIVLNNDSLTILFISALFAIFFMFSIPGLMSIVICYYAIYYGEGDNFLDIIKQSATPLLGLIVGIIVTMKLSSPELAIISHDPDSSIIINLFKYFAHDPDFSTIINLFKYLAAGTISAISALITKLIFSAIWR